MASKFIYLALICLVANSLCSAQPIELKDNDNELHLNPTEASQQTNNNDKELQTIELENNKESTGENEIGFRKHHLFNPFRMFHDWNPFWGIFKQMEQHREELEQQFEQFERQAGEDDEVSYFTLNGVQYVKTCATKKVEPRGQQESLIDIGTASNINSQVKKLELEGGESQEVSFISRNGVHYVRTCVTKRVDSDNKEEPKSTA